MFCFLVVHRGNPAVVKTFEDKIGSEVIVVRHVTTPFNENDNSQIEIKGKIYDQIIYDQEFGCSKFLTVD